MDAVQQAGLARKRASIVNFTSLKPPQNVRLVRMLEHLKLSGQQEGLAILRKLSTVPALRFPSHWHEKVIRFAGRSQTFDVNQVAGNLLERVGFEQASDQCAAAITESGLKLPGVCAARALSHMMSKGASVRCVAALGAQALTDLYVHNFFVPKLSSACPSFQRAFYHGIGRNISELGVQELERGENLDQLCTLLKAQVAPGALRAFWRAVGKRTISVYQEIIRGRAGWPTLTHCENVIGRREFVHFLSRSYAGSAADTAVFKSALEKELAALHALETYSKLSWRVRLECIPGGFLSGAEVEIFQRDGSDQESRILPNTNPRKSYLYFLEEVLKLKRQASTLLPRDYTSAVHLSNGITFKDRKFWFDTERKKVDPCLTLALVLLTLCANTPGRMVYALDKRMLVDIKFGPDKITRVPGFSRITARIETKCLSIGFGASESTNYLEWYVHFVDRLRKMRPTHDALMGFCRMLYRAYVKNELLPAYGLHFLESAETFKEHEEFFYPALQDQMRSWESLPDSMDGVYDSACSRLRDYFIDIMEPIVKNAKGAALPSSPEADK